jgi:hypothetical protein
LPSLSNNFQKNFSVLKATNNNKFNRFQTLATLRSINEINSEILKNRIKLILTKNFQKDENNSLNKLNKKYCSNENENIELVINLLINQGMIEQKYIELGGKLTFALCLSDSLISVVYTIRKNGLS